jgi:hypothetical protein
MFRRLAVISTVAVLCFVMAGCYSIKVCAPAGADVSLASTEKSLPFKKEVRSWYVVWGLVPIVNEDGVQQIIKDNNLSDVRVTTKMTFIDWLVSYFLGIATIQTRTAIVEGSAE